MSHCPGIHLFYPNGTTLAHAFFDGLNWTGGQPITIEGGPTEWYTPAGAWGTNIREQRSTLPVINSGVSAIYVAAQEKIYVFYTGFDKSVYVMGYSLATDTLQYIGSVPGVSTTDVTAAVEQYGRVSLYYKDAGGVNNGGPASVVLQFSGNTMSVVASPVSIDVPGQPTSWGPAVVLRNGNPNLIYGDNNNVLRMAWQTDSGSWRQLDPQQAWLSYTPTAVVAGNDIVALYHSHSSRDLWCDVNDISDNWTQTVANRAGAQNQEYIIGGGPGACVFGGRIYCFMQGPSMEMYCQIYVGHQWLQAPLLVSDNSGNSLCSSVWWGPAAVAV